MFFFKPKSRFFFIHFSREKVSILLSSSYCVFVSDGINLLSGANDNERGSHVCTNRVNYSRPLPLLQWNAAISEEAKHQKRYIDSTNAGYFPWLNLEASRCQKRSCVNSPGLSFWSVTTQSRSHLPWHFHNNVCVWLCGWLFACVNSDRLSHNTTQSWTLKVIVEVLYWLSDNWWVSLSTLIAKKPAGKREQDLCDYWKMPTRLKRHSDEINVDSKKEPAHMQLKQLSQRSTDKLSRTDAEKLAKLVTVTAVSANHSGKEKSMTKEKFTYINFLCIPSAIQSQSKNTVCMQ